MAEVEKCSVHDISISFMLTHTLDANTPMIIGTIASWVSKFTLKQKMIVNISAVNVMNDAIAVKSSMAI